MAVLKYEVIAIKVVVFFYLLYYFLLHHMTLSRIFWGAVGQTV